VLFSYTYTRSHGTTNNAILVSHTSYCVLIMGLALHLITSFISMYRTTKIICRDYMHCEDASRNKSDGQDTEKDISYTSTVEIHP